MSLNLNLGLFLITQNHVFPSSWPVWVESLYFDLHYKYMFYNNCSTCALCIVHHYDISYLTPFVFLFYKKDGLKRSLSPPAPPPPSPPSSLVPVCNTWVAMRFGFRDLFYFLLAIDIQTDGQGARCCKKRCPSLAEARRGEANPCREWHSPLCRGLVGRVCHGGARTGRERDQLVVRGRLSASHAAGTRPRSWSVGPILRYEPQGTEVRLQLLQWHGRPL